MSVLDSMYAPPAYEDNEEADELELALQEAYEAGVSDGYDYALDEGFMDKLKAAGGKIKSWAQRNPRLSGLMASGAGMLAANTIRNKLTGRTFKDEYNGNSGKNGYHRYGALATGAAIGRALHNRLTRS